MEAARYNQFFTSVVDNDRCVYLLTQSTLFAGAPDIYMEYDIEGLGQVHNNFTRGLGVAAAFVVVGSGRHEEIERPWWVSCD